MDRKKSYYSSYFSERFGDVSNSDTEGDSYGGDSISNFLDKIPDQSQQNPEENNQIEGKNEQNEQDEFQERKSSNQNNSTAPKENLKESKLINKVDSSILVFGQFLNPIQISESFMKKPAPSINIIAERMKVLLYSERDISNAMKNFLKLRYRRKENSLDSFEYFILLFLCRHFPNANEDTIMHYHYLFWGGHAMGLLLRNLGEVQKQDPFVFIHAFAASMAELEKDCIDVEFSSSDLSSVGLWQESYNLWKKSINDDKNKNEVVDLTEPPNKIDFDPTNIEKLEQVESFLNQSSFSPITLAKLISPEIEIDITLKTTVIGDRDPDVDINLSKVPNFQVDESHESLCLLMLKNDLCFYKIGRAHV